MSPGQRLIGREQALAIAESVLAEALSGSGQLLLITGEAGIGKTALLTALAERAGPDSAVLRGFCWTAGVPPYWPWAQALRAADLPVTALGDAAWLLNATESAPAAATAGEARFRLFDAVSRCLAGIAERRPVLVVLDDLQWADEASLELLSFLASSLSPYRVMLLGAYRDTEASAQLRELAGRAQELPLRGLTRSEVMAMVEAMPGPAPAAGVAAQLWERTAGNPFFVRELARLARVQGPADAVRLPAGVAETLRRRLARLSSDCVRLLGWAAVAGRDIDLALLADSGLGADRSGWQELLGEARTAGVVTGETPPRFVHDLYRETILDGLGAGEREAINLRLAKAMTARGGNAALIASHLLAAGPEARAEAAEYCVAAAREATARLGHSDACSHYLRALELIDEQPDHRVDVLLELAAAQERAGRPALAMDRLREVASLSRARGDAVRLAGAALGMQALGNRSGAENTEVAELLKEAADLLAATGGPLNLQSRVVAALTRVIRHGAVARPGADLVHTAERAVELATAAADPNALAMAMLALHDSLWVPGTAEVRLPVIADMLRAAEAGGDAELVAEAHLLRAAALLELGDPVGREELLRYVDLAGKLGRARGRWGALTRQATFAQIAGRAEEAARLGEQAVELGLAIGEPDALGCFYTSRWALVALGVREPAVNMVDSDPMWPMYPLLNAWPLVVRGELVAAKAALGDFSALDIAVWTGLEGLAVAAVVFAAVGSRDQCAWAYQQLSPYAGTHVVVGGCASYHAAVDHHLGELAASLGDVDAAEQHFRAAVAMHERLGAAGWLRLSEQRLAGVLADREPGNEFRLIDGRWSLGFAGRHAWLPEAKGLRDIATLIGAHGAEVHVFTLIGREHARTGADPVLDERAKAEFKARLQVLADEIDDAEAAGAADRAEQLAAERSLLIRELASATGLGGRSRLLADETERARKTVSARVRDALGKIDDVHPGLGEHLHAALRMGTVCSYTPPTPTRWNQAS